jgi:hypothetical protein
MMKRSATVLLTFFFVLLFPPGPEIFAQTTLWVVSDGARLHAEKTAASPTVASLPLNAALTRIATDGKWHQVETEDGKTGWVYRGKVSDAKPGADGDALDDLLGDLGESDILLAAADTSRSIRGRTRLDASDERSDIPEPLRRALDRVLSFYVSDAETDAFLKEGRIGEYAD